MKPATTSHGWSLSPVTSSVISRRKPRTVRSWRGSLAERISATYPPIRLASWEGSVAGQERRRSAMDEEPCPDRAGTDLDGKVDGVGDVLL
jgi:hypothetical protein